MLQSFLLCIKWSEHGPAQKVVENFTTLMCIYRSSRTEQVIKCPDWFAKYCIHFKIIKSMDIMPQCFSFLCIANRGFHFNYSRHLEILDVLFILSYTFN